MVCLAMLFAVWFGIGEGFSVARAQDPAPGPGPASKQKLAYVRFLNMLPGKDSEVLKLLAADNKPLATATPANYYADYLPVAPGAFTLTVCRASDLANPLKRLPVNLPADTSITVLVSAKDGQPLVEAVNDTSDPQSGNVGRLVLRQYVADATVTASIGNTPPTPALNCGDTITLENLPAAPTMINLQATLASKATKTWTVPADFTKHHRATLFVVTDLYGRFRPLLIWDGHGADSAVNAHH